MTDKIIGKLLNAIFSVPSVLVHIAVFTTQIIFHIDENKITNYISWEAIFLSLLIGIQQIRHAESVKQHITKTSKEVK